MDKNAGEKYFTRVIKENEIIKKENINILRNPNKKKTHLLDLIKNVDKY